MEPPLEADGGIATGECFDNDFDCLIGDDFDEWDDMESDEVATAGRPPSVISTQSIAATIPTPQRPPPR